MRILQAVKQFLHTNLKQGSSLLLGFSGGPDSLALLHLLLACREWFSFDLHLAHVDHNWREESGREAAYLKQEAEKLGIPFHLHVLDACKGEAEAREERLKFFHRLYTEKKFQALLLAHQADDQAETVLKRIFEGKHLFSLGGLQPISEIQGMSIWRPLLSIPKSEILEWLKSRNLAGLDDWTNRDPRFLRARMRTQIFPELERVFGKEIVSNLACIGKAAQDLKAYISTKLTPYLSSVKKGPFGLFLDINPFYPIDNVELTELIRSFVEEEEAFISHAGLEMLVGQLQAKAPNKRLECNGQVFIADRGRLFILNRPLPNFNFEGPLKSQTIVQDNWIFEFTESKDKPNRSSSWEDAWMGKAIALLPEGNYKLVSPGTAMPFPGTSPIRKWWNEKKIPAFLRSCFPCIALEGKVVHDFLTGKKNLKEPLSKDLLIISLEIKNR